jgi:hypothetical protein
MLRALFFAAGEGQGDRYGVSAPEGEDRGQTNFSHATRRLCYPRRAKEKSHFLPHRRTGES